MANTQPVLLSILTIAEFFAQNLVSFDSQYFKTKASAFS
jgi:hypothetical protein